MADPDFITNHPITRAAVTKPHHGLNMQIQIATPGVAFKRAGHARQVVAASSAWTVQPPPFSHPIDIDIKV